MPAPLAPSSATDTSSLLALARLLASEAPYESCSCRFPAQSAYQRLKPIALDEVWTTAARNSVIIQVQVPSSSLHCSCCQPAAGLVFDAELARQYVDTMACQLEAISTTLEPIKCAAVLFGGDAVHLGLQQCERMFTLVDQHLHYLPLQVPVCADLSLTSQNVALVSMLAQQRIKHINVAVHSFVDAERQALHLIEPGAPGMELLMRVKDAGTFQLRLGLSYGIAGQTVASLRHSLRNAVNAAADAIYLCPLYPPTTAAVALPRSGTMDRRLELYRAGRDFLHHAGYWQQSLRCFIRQQDTETSTLPHASRLGIGFAVSSQTPALHYSDGSVHGSGRITTKLKRWLGHTVRQFMQVDYGYALTRAEQGRSFALASLFRTTGLDIERYYNAMGADILDDIPDLAALITMGLFEYNGVVIKPTVRGLELADALRPWLFAERQRFALNASAF